MGYRSDVAYVITGKKDELIPIIMTFRLTYEDPEYSRAVLNECSYALNDDELTIKFEAHCKWYEGFSDVDSHIAFFNAFRDAVSENEDSSINGAFARIGEDETDIVTECFGTDDPYDLVHVIRSIEVNVIAGKNISEVLGDLK